MENTIESMFVGFDIDLLKSETAMSISLFNRFKESLEFNELREIPKEARDIIIRNVLSAVDKFILDCKVLDASEVPNDEKS